MRIKALYKELPPSERVRTEHLDDDGYRGLQNLLLANPQVGAVIEGTGGLRRLRYSDSRRGKDRRGGIRVIYYRWQPGRQFWLFTIFDKDEAKPNAQAALLLRLVQRYPDTVDRLAEV